MAHARNRHPPALAKPRQIGIVNTKTGLDVSTFWKDMSTFEAEKSGHSPGEIPGKFWPGRIFPGPHPGAFVNRFAGPGDLVAGAARLACDLRAGAA